MSNINIVGKIGFSWLLDSRLISHWLKKEKKQFWFSFFHLRLGCYLCKMATITTPRNDECCPISLLTFMQAAAATLRSLAHRQYKDNID